LIPYLKLFQNKFREDNFAAAMNVLSTVTQPVKHWGQPNRPTASNPDNESNCFKLVKMIMERNFAPVIVFSFSKKDCENYAMQMSKLDFTSGDYNNCFRVYLVCF